MIDITYLNAGTPHIKTDAVNIYIDGECVALVRNERSIAIVKAKLRNKLDSPPTMPSTTEDSESHGCPLSWAHGCEICGEHDCVC